MSNNNDFWGSYNGSSWNPNNPQWRIGQQMRQIEQQKQAFHKQQMSSGSPAPYSGTPIELGPKTKAVLGWTVLALIIGAPVILGLINLIYGW